MPQIHHPLRERIDLVEGGKSEPLGPLDQIPHRIERTRNRHSRASIDGDMIVIRLAKNLTQREEREHIESLLRRMARHLRKETSRQKIDPFLPLLEGTDTLTIRTATDHTYRITIERSPKATRNHTKKTLDGWHMKLAHGIRKPALNRLLWKTLASMEAKEIDERIRLINRQTLRADVRSTRLQYASSQWGSCSHKGVIMLNTALLCTSEDLLDYVIIHELAHCLHKNHSKRYWDLVESMMPDFGEARKKLREFRLLPL